jgi:hypothetical protein
MVKLDFWLARCDGLDRKNINKKKSSGDDYVFKRRKINVITRLNLN